MTGTLRRKGETYEMSWDSAAELETAHNEAGRGCELSELVKFNDALYTFDDRTGIMFQIMNPARSDSAEVPYLVPRHIFSEGPGNVGDKGLKIEWATVKDGAIIIGSFGKEVREFAFLCVFWGFTTAAFFAVFTSNTLNFVCFHCDFLPSPPPHPTIAPSRFLLVYK